MIVVTVRGADAVAEAWRHLPAAIEQRLAAAAASFGATLGALVQDVNLDGAVLQRRSGRMADSIAVTTEQAPGKITVRVGSDVAYGAFQEYGFTGSETVRQHLRTLTQAFGRPIKGGAKRILVSTYQRRIDYPPHSFLASALAQSAQGGIEQIKAAVGDALAEG